MTLPAELRGVVRDGELSSRSLVDAALDERARGRRPRLLAVGSSELEVLALAILKDEGPLGDLRGDAPAVVVDWSLSEREWELREV